MSREIASGYRPRNDRHQQRDIPDPFVAALDERRISLPELLALDEPAPARFRGTPVMRARRRGLVRNACVAAGNVGRSGPHSAAGGPAG